MKFTTGLFCGLALAVAAFAAAQSQRTECSWIRAVDSQLVVIDDDLRRLHSVVSEVADKIHD